MIRSGKMAKFELKKGFKLSIPCERAHCQLQKLSKLLESDLPNRSYDYNQMFEMLESVIPVMTNQM